MRNKALIQLKIKQIKDAGRDINEIYKYTNNIIFEDDDEQIETNRQKAAMLPSGFDSPNFDR